MKSKRRKPGRRPEVVAEGTRHAIIDAARALFAVHGFEAVSLRAIAERAGLAHGLLRHHFGSKHDVWLAVIAAVDTEFKEALTALDDLERSDADLRALGRAFILRMTEVHARHPDAMRLVLHESISGGPRLEALLQVLAPVQRQVAALVRRFHAAGLLREHAAERFFLFLVIATAAPWTLPALTVGLTGKLPTPEHHAKALATTLFGA